MEGFLAFINEHRLFNPTDRLLVAVSGGIDSVVLADLLHRHGYTFGIAHVNFSLRGDESDADADFVQNMALRYGVPCHQVRVDTLAEAGRRGESVQVTARQLRYEWFQQLRLDHGYVAVLTAHHLDDVLETVLLNLTRGTGLTGLTGIPIRTEAGVVRPLWFASRAQIEAYAQAQGLTWREDSSNGSDKYARNRIRHQVVPVLKEINPGLLAQLPQTLANLRAADQLLGQTTQRSWAEVARTDQHGTQIDVQAVRALPEPLFQLGEWLRPYGFTPAALQQFWQSVDQSGVSSVKNGQMIDSATHRLVHERGKIWLLAQPGTLPGPVVVTALPTEPIRLPGAGYVEVESITRADWDGALKNPPTVALFDADLIPMPWTFRRWQMGDRFEPLGLNGSQLVSDLLTNLKVAAHRRSHVWVLEAGGHIAWVVGLRMAHPFRLTEATQQLLRLHLSL